MNNQNTREFFSAYDSEVANLISHFSGDSKIKTLLKTVAGQSLQGKDVFKAMTKAKMFKPLRVYINDYNDRNTAYDLLNAQVVHVILGLCQTLKDQIDGLDKFIPKGSGQDDAPQVEVTIGSRPASDTDIFDVMSAILGNINHSVTQLNTTTGNNIMNTSTKAVAQVTRIFGTDADNLSDDDIFSHIRALESSVVDMKKMKNAPKAMKNRIKDAEASIKDLVKFLDDRTDADSADS